MLAWARLGGTLVVAGRNATGVVDKNNEFAAWTEKRFIKDPAGDFPQAHAFGLGTLIVCDCDDVFLHSDLVTKLRETLRNAQPWTPRLGTWWGDVLTAAFPGLRSFPFVPFLLALLAFVIIIGPVNFIFLKSRGKPMLLLVTIPALAGITTIFFIGYSIISQGFNIKGAVASLTLLDQRSHQADTAENRAIFAGFLPSAGLTPGAGTVVLPVGDVNKKTHELLYANLQDSYRWDLAEGLMSGGYLPARKLTRQMILTDQTARKRLLIQRAGPRLSIENGLDASIRWLQIRDGAGKAYQLSTPLAAGGRADLDAAANADNLAAFPNIFNVGMDVPSTYWAVLDRSPFADACGIEVEEVYSQHYLAGVLPEREANWK